MRPHAMLLAVVVLAASSAIAQRVPAPPSSTDLVELDVVVRDGNGQPVSDLGQQDFQIKEDGHPIAIKTFSAVKTGGSTAPQDARLIALLLDDAGVPMAGTGAVQGIARLIATQGGPGDEVTVIRLNNRADEAFGDLDTALRRIDDYHAGIVPFAGIETQQNALRAIAAMAGQLGLFEHRRKSIVCIGSPATCNVEEPPLKQRSLLWRHWVEAMAATARANVSVYAVTPATAGRVRLDAGGLVDLTGGESFGNTNNFVRVSERIWSDASQYYLLGYWPSTPRRELHSIEVKVGRKGMRVRARGRRGD